MLRGTAIVFMLALLAAPAQAQQQAEPIDLNDIRERTVDALDEMRTYRADDVLERIRGCLARFTEVSAQMLEAPPGQEDQYIDDLIEFYEYAAEEFEDIDSHREDVLRTLSELRSDLGEMIREAEQEVRRLRTRITEVDGMPISTDEFKREADLQQRATLKELYSQQIAALGVWTTRYQEVIRNAGDISTAVDRLLYVIGLSVPVYEQSAATLTMNQDLRNAMALFESQEEIQNLTSEVISSWIQTETLIADALQSLGTVQFPLISD